MSHQSVTIASDIDLLQLHQRHPQRYPYLLASTATSSGLPQQNCRYDILFAFPGEQLILDNNYQLHGDDRYCRDNDFLNSLDNWFSAEADTGIQQDLPFTGGWFVYLAYELAQQVEPSLQLPTLPQGHPVAVASRIPAAIIRDHVTNRLILVAETAHESLLQQMQADIDAVGHAAVEPVDIHVSDIEEDVETAYFAQVKRILSYIVEGDIFQANLSRLWQFRLQDDCSDSDIFRALAKANPSSFACLARFDELSLISSSPERLVRVEDGKVETRPIAGTRPRHATGTQDSALSTELLAHPKERAEHIMLIDLERNDLGRVCEAGSIKVDELLTLESWQHVHHIVSNIQGRLRDDVLPGDVLRAVFPGGTITGCPKVRCMEILAEQEQVARSAYTGSLGYINRNGNMDTNILIRTMLRQQDSLSFRAGGGIVADSDPVMELAETRAKARGMLKALQSEEVVA